MIEKSYNNLRGAGDGTCERTPEASAECTSAEHEAGAAHGADGHGRPAGKESGPDFPFKQAYQRLLNMFYVHPNPYAKLNALNELEHLIVASLLSSGSERLRASRSDAGSSVVEEQAAGSRQTQLDGTIDTVKERRSQALQTAFLQMGDAHQGRKVSSETRSIVSGSATNTDVITRELQSLLRDASVRPKSLFRDLQLVAAFVPPSVLDRPEKGKAFWNTGLAALKLKSEVCRMMMEMADEVIAAHTRARKTPGDGAVPGEAAAAPSATGTPPPPAMAYKLDDGGKMWAITAKKGYPTAQRELALLYLSNPEAVEQTTVPLSKPREVFKQTVMERYGRSERGARASMGAAGANAMGGAGAGGRAAGGGSGDGQGLGGNKEGDVRNDAGLMCLAVHWMEAAEQGGDELALSFLRQNEFMGLG